MIHYIMRKHDIISYGGSDNEKSETTKGEIQHQI